MMNVEQAIDLVHARLVDEHSLVVKLRTRQALCKQEVDEWLVAVDFLAAHYQDHARVPKRLASAFIDIYGSFSINDGFYDEVQSRWHEEFGIVLQDKAYELFG